VEIGKTETSISRAATSSRTVVPTADLAEPPTVTGAESAGPSAASA
jgi:hypothetical protein